MAQSPRARDGTAMVQAIASDPALDLSTLPAPVIIAQPDFETRLAGKVSRFVATALDGGYDFSALVESDPAIMLLEADSYDEMTLVQAVSDAAKGLLLAFATGANLDQLGALYDTPRLTITPAAPPIPAVMEDDTSFRRRILLAPHSFSVAGPKGAYIYHAMSASGDVLDVGVTSPNPGEVLVSILSRTGTGAAPPATITLVTNRLNGDTVRPLTDFVTVQSVQIVDFHIVAGLYVFAGPDEALILATALASLNAFLAGAKRCGRDIPRSAIIAALHVGGVQRVELDEPLADLVFTAHQAGHALTITVTVDGTAN